MVLLKPPLWDFLAEVLREDDFDNTKYALAMFILLLVLFLLAFIVWIIWDEIYGALDKKKATYIIYTGELIDKKYKGESSSSGIGTAVVPNSNGGMGIGIVSTRSSSPEEFLFFIRTTRANVYLPEYPVRNLYKLLVSMEEYYSRNVGEEVQFEVCYGGLSKVELSMRVLPKTFKS